MKTTAKKLCSTAKKSSQTKPSKETKDIMDKRSRTMKGTPECYELNNVIRKKTRNSMRNQNTKLIKTVIENNENMKVLKTHTLTKGLRIDQLKKTQK